MAIAALTAQGWYGAALRYDSPHCDARPDPTALELLVIHNISLPAGRFGGPHIADLFSGRLDLHALHTQDGHGDYASLRALRVSSHFLIRRDGAVLQFVPTLLRAWHAGVSQFEGRERCNDFSIGIELEGSDNVAFSPVQYAALAELSAALLARHRLRAVLGHEHIAPGRKTDPGPFFEWPRYAAALAAQVAKAGAADPGLVLAHRALRFPPSIENVKPAPEKKA
ncbi:MAG: 1,6-anhydro-N-acetylmuramyl-L-alanine amidase AmpD [Pseudomonadota bacterium]